MLGLGLLPFAFLRKQPVKDWVIVFFFTGFLASLLDGLAVKTKRIMYPIRLFPTLFNKSVVFDYLLFPIICTFYIQSTHRSTLLGTLGKVFIFSVPVTILEWMLERKTYLVDWIRWSGMHTFASITLYLLSARGIISLINKFSKIKLLENNEKEKS